MLATEYASYYDIEPQREGEGDFDFRNRVAGALRAKGKLIEAHEAYQDARYENSDDVMTGVVGAVAQAMNGTNYSGDKIGNDIAAGIVVTNPTQEMTPEMALVAVLLAGL